MKALRFTASAVLLVTVLSINTFSQDTSNNFRGQLYFQAGCSYFCVKSNAVKSKQDGNIGILGSIYYQILPKVRLQINYTYAFETYDYRKASYIYYPPDFVDHETYSGITSHKMNIGVNYFLTNKVGHLMTFLTGALVSSFEKEKSYNELNFGEHTDSSGHYESYFVRQVIEQHNRFLIGPEIGAGIFMVLGRFNFQQGLTFSKIFSIYNDRNYSEFWISFNTGIVYKF